MIISNGSFNGIFNILVPGLVSSPESTVCVIMILSSKS